jgi:hypothetical protein
LFGRFILNRFSKPNELVWFIIITFFAINILIVVLDRYVIPGYYLIDDVKAFVPGVLIGVYLYLILAALGIIKPSRRNYPKNI